MILRSLVKLMVILVLAFSAVAYLAYLRTGVFWLPSFTAPGFLNFNKPPVMEPLPEISHPAYKWRENGRWVYGDDPPAGVTPVKLNKESQ